MFLSSIVAFDRYCILSITGLQSQVLDPVMIAFTKIGDAGAVWLLWTAILLLWKKYRHAGTMVFAGLATNLVLGEWILKHLFQRDRPFLELHEVILKIPAPVTSSFPSGHTSASWCFAILFTTFFWERSKLSVLLVWMIAIGITVSRLYLQVHYPSDILGGMATGMASALLVICLCSKSIPRFCRK